jgi:protein-S-isoprenylcysteine O-methyltransferase Ste14
MSLFILPGLDYRFHWSNVPLVVSVIADGFVALSFFFIFLVFKENSFASATIEVAQEQTVITSGPYRIVRHPMYAAALLLFIATALALGSWVALVCSVLLSFTLAARLIDEEKYLMVNLPGYAEYRRQVRYRLIPFIW